MGASAVSRRHRASIADERAKDFLRRFPNNPVGGVLRQRMSGGGDRGSSAGDSGSPASLIRDQPSRQPAQLQPHAAGPAQDLVEAVAQRRGSGSRSAHAEDGPVQVASGQNSGRLGAQPVSLMEVPFSRHTTEVAEPAVPARSRNGSTAGNSTADLLASQTRRPPAPTVSSLLPNMLRGPTAEPAATDTLWLTPPDSPIQTSASSAGGGPFLSLSSAPSGRSTAATTAGAGVTALRDQGSPAAVKLRRSGSLPPPSTADSAGDRLQQSGHTSCISLRSDRPAAVQQEAALPSPPDLALQQKAPPHPPSAASNTSAFSLSGSAYAQPQQQQQGGSLLRPNSAPGGETAAAGGAPQPGGNRSGRKRGFFRWARRLRCIW